MKNPKRADIKVTPKNVSMVIAAVEALGGRVLKQTVILTVETPRSLKGRCFVGKPAPFYESSGRRSGRVR